MYERMAGTAEAPWPANADTAVATLPRRCRANRDAAANATKVMATSSHSLHLFFVDTPLRPI